MLLYKRKWRYSMLLALLLVGLLAGIQLKDKYFKFSKNLEIFATILKELDSHYVDEVDTEALVKTGIDAMLRSLDPYTTFFSEEDLESLEVSITGEYGGIGAIIGSREGKAIIFMLFKDQPAHKGGLHAGDKIIQINGEDVVDSSHDHIVKLIKGMPGTSVQLSVIRDGVAQPLAFTLNREQVTMKNVPYYGQLQQHIGYIKLASFTPHAADEVKAALASIKEKGAEKLILDLRGNAGGILEEAIRVANLLIAQNLTVVTTKGKAATLIQSYTTTQPAYDKTMPVIVLIDQTSASAAEIVAGVIQDYDRGVLIGKSTFGKGLVQSVTPLHYNTQLKLTTAKYYIPSGRCIQKINHSLHRQEKVTEEDVDKPVFMTQAGRRVYESNGIAPDIEVEELLRLAPITVSLIANNLIFDYATRFQAQHARIQPAREFRLSDSQYEQFLAWLQDKDYAYTIENSLDQLLKKAEEESYTEGIKKQIASLKAQVQCHKKEELQKFKSEIKRILQQTIVARYYFQEGAIAVTLEHDKAIQKACALFQDMAQYYTHLKVAE